MVGVLICLTACGTSDDPSPKGNGGSGSSGSSETPQLTKHIAKVITEDGGSIIEYSLSYDSQGRVSKIISTQSGTGTNSHSEKTYQYGETLIVTKEVTEGKYSNGDSFSRSESHSFSLNNGLIFKDEEIQNGNTSTDIISYDAKNYISSINTKIYIWSDGNLTKLGNRSYENSNYPWAKNFPLYLDGSNMDEFLFAMGYYVNIPKNLPSKTITSETSGATYDYTFDGSYVTKFVITPLVETNKNHKTTSTIIWE